MNAKKQREKQREKQCEKKCEKKCESQNRGKAGPLTSGLLALNKREHKLHPLDSSGFAACAVLRRSAKKAFNNAPHSCASIPAVNCVW